MPPDTSMCPLDGKLPLVENHWPRHFGADTSHLYCALSKFLTYRNHEKWHDYRCLQLQSFGVICCIARHSGFLPWGAWGPFSPACMRGRQLLHRSGSKLLIFFISLIFRYILCTEVGISCKHHWADTRIASGSERPRHLPLTSHDLSLHFSS